MMMNSETTSRFQGETMPQLLGFGVVWTLNDVRPVRTPRPTRRRDLDHRDWGYSWDGERYVALRASVLNLMVRMMLVQVDNAL